MLVLETGRVRGVRRREHTSGLHRMVSADHYLLAAGAFGTPVLLERSRLADQSDELDRNHMFHFGMLAIAVFARWSVPIEPSSSGSASQASALQPIRR